MKMEKLRLGFLASHGGSNMQAIIDSIKAGGLDAEACVVISNNSGSGAIERAKKEGIPYYHISSVTHPDPENMDNEMIDALLRHGAEIIILAGYMKKIPPKFIEAFRGKILNIHPALLPKFGGEGFYGMKVHEAVIAAGETVSGATIHIVDEKYDHGRILHQFRVDVLKEDTPETLAQRVLGIEHLLYTQTLQMISGGEIEL
jgi:phosphoribosylglycinamide formyltransferase-1